jgi:acylphosphatase
MNCRKFIVHGKVQGVWFRESTRKVAVHLGLSGHAINLPDGTVEVLARGEAAALDELARWLRQGPPMASVDDLHQCEYQQEITSGFRTTLIRSNGPN